MPDPNLPTRTVTTNGVDLDVVRSREWAARRARATASPSCRTRGATRSPRSPTAGYRVLAPDQRGYGRRRRPDAIEDYDIDHLTDDLLGLLDDIGEERAVFVGHDWGSMVVWQLALLRARARRRRRRHERAVPPAQPDATRSR